MSLRKDSSVQQQKLKQYRNSIDNRLSTDLILQNLKKQYSEIEKAEPLQKIPKDYNKYSTNISQETQDIKEEGVTDKPYELDFYRLQIQSMVISKESIKFQEYKEAADKILYILGLRDKYIFNKNQDMKGINNLVVLRQGNRERIIDYSIYNEIPEQFNKFELKCQRGIFSVYENGLPVFSLPDISEYMKDYQYILEQVNDKLLISFCHFRNQLLQQKFKIHLMFNQDKEDVHQRSVPEQDFYRIKKVDNHIHHTAFMSARVLVDFMSQKFKEEGDVQVYYCKNTKQKKTLSQVLQMLQINPNHISVDMLNVQMDSLSPYQRFNRFTLKYNPVGQPVLREIFLKTDNIIEGRYTAELTHKVFKELEASTYEYSEPRISLYGRSTDEWSKMARWFIRYKVFSPNVRWLIQIPRLYNEYKKQKVIANFGQMLNNIFQPLFEVTLNPASNPKLHKMLLQVVGFDSIDDESVFEKSGLQELSNIPPEKWDYDQNPPYLYWSYYLYINLLSLNQLRNSIGLNTFKYRPHCGESSNIDHLVTAYQLAHSINHGVKLQKSPVLLYLYYLKQIGLSVSPLSNNKLFLTYPKNPFHQFFAEGLNVSLSTDDPLVFHLTKEPLVEEYAIASQIWNLSQTDLSEIARNSVIQSGIEDILKKEWLGEHYQEFTARANEVNKTKVPQIRWSYRIETLNEEFSHLEYFAGQKQ